jgi:hypothetical protein
VRVTGQRVEQFSALVRQASADLSRLHRIAYAPAAS